MAGLAGLYTIAASNHGIVDCFDLKSREALSMMDLEGNCHIAMDPIKLSSMADEKWKLSHELGHCVTGRFYHEFATCDRRQKHENCADKWAIEQLIPVNEFDEAMALGYTEMWDLAEYFGVSEDFIRKAVCWYIHGNLATKLYF